MSCKNICFRYKINKDRRGSYYNKGYKRCTICEVFLNWHGSKCPCCGWILRIRARNQTPKIEVVNFGNEQQLRNQVSIS
jgi:hypothetical protein